MKLGYFITARLKSSRLKNKILLRINGKTILGYVIERCQAVLGIKDVVLCTSVNPQDSILFPFSQKYKIEFYPGSEEDVLYRLLKAAEYYGYDGFLSITADNPLVSPYFSQLLLDFYKQEGFDFGFIKGLPIGFSPYFLSTRALKVAVHMKKRSDTEIWGPFVKRQDFFSIGEIIVKNAPYSEICRLTCDYPEDFNLIRLIYENLNYSSLIDVFNIFQLLQNNPSLLNTNSKRGQIRTTNSKISAINEEFDKMKDEGKAFAKSHGIGLKPGYTSIEIAL